ncbi:MAG: hypothetical protein M5R41_19360 [Bacteroidia bacterium]|nr:hypothetical protein [Bacteroidia bacterium]
MSQDFNTIMPPTIPITKEDYTLAHGHQVKWGVLEIMPLKTEIEALGEGQEAVDIRKLVPWRAGIILRAIALKSRVVLEDGRSIIRELYTCDPNGNVALSYNGKYMSQWCKLDLGEVERGWARQYSREKRKLVYDLPPNWDAMRPEERYAYWLGMLGGRYGFPIGSLQEGSTFYGYFTRSKSESTGKWYSDVKKVYKDGAGDWHDACPTELGSIDVPVLRKLAMLIEDEYQRNDPASFNFGANVGRQQSGNGHGNGGGVRSFDEEAGF